MSSCRYKPSPATVFVSMAMSVPRWPLHCRYGINQHQYCLVPIHKACAWLECKFRLLKSPAFLQIASPCGTVQRTHQVMPVDAPAPALEPTTAVITGTPVIAAAPVAEAHAGQTALQSLIQVRTRHASIELLMLRPASIALCRKDRLQQWLAAIL